MKVITTNVSPPIPVRSHDWQAHFDGMEESGPYGHGATKRDALNNLLDNCELEDLISWFGIETQEVDTDRGPEYGHWNAKAPDGTVVSAAWEDQAIVDLVAKLIGAE